MEHDDEDENPPFFDRRNNQYDLKTKIIFTAIASLAIVVLIITILHVYTKCILRRQLRRRATALDRITATSNNPSQTPPIDPPKIGLDPQIIASLPTLVIKKNDEMNSTMECSICLSSLEVNEVARILPNCKHFFHAECIDKWLEIHLNCPVCRSEAEPRRVQVAETWEGVVAPPTAPPLEGLDYPTVAESTEGASTSDTSGLLQFSSSKNGPQTSRLSSFRRILSRERSRTNQSQSSCGEDGSTHNGINIDLERQ